MARFNLGYSLMRPFPHKEVCQFAEEVLRGQNPGGLDLEPRGAFKTSVFSQALPVKEIILNPNIRILLDSVVLQNSVDNLGVIKAHFDSPKVKFLYGDFIGSKWTTEEITVSKRTNKTLKEPTVRCASVEKVQVGPHYDLIIPDDLVSKENIETPEQRKKVIDHFRLLFSLLDPGGKILVIGTRWHFQDLYNLILTEFPEFAHRVMSAETSGPDGGLYFKERLTSEFLGDQKRRLGRDHYSAQYLNDPAPEDEHSRFQSVWFKPYDVLPLGTKAEPSPLYSFLSVDPGGRKKNSDKWVFFNAFADSKFDLYFHRFIRGHYRMDEAVDLLFKLIEEIKPISVGLETTGAQKYILESIQDQMRKRGKYFHVVPLSHAVHSKEYRIQRLVPRYECGSIFHSKEMGPLEDELRRFPKGADDLADGAAMILEIAVSPRSRKKKQEINSVDDLIWRQLKKDRTRKYGSPILGSQW